MSVNASISSWISTVFGSPSKLGKDPVTHVSVNKMPFVGCRIFLMKKVNLLQLSDIHYCFFRIDISLAVVSVFYSYITPEIRGV